MLVSLRTRESNKMSIASKRGRDFELKVAARLRHRLKINVQRDKQSGAGWNKADISDYGNALPLHMELKDQQNIKIQEWFRQAVVGSSFGKAPSVVFAVDEEILVTLRLDDLINFLAEIRDVREEVADLHKPGVVVGLDLGAEDRSVTTIFCGNGHLCDPVSYCLQLDCKFSRGYRPPKAKRK